jgi:hypothetical protein
MSIYWSQRPIEYGKLEVNNEDNLVLIVFELVNLNLTGGN